MVYYHQQPKIDLARGAKVAIERATYASLSPAFKPVAGLRSGILPGARGLGWAFHLATVFVLLSVLPCLALRRTLASPAGKVSLHAEPSVVA